LGIFTNTGRDNAAATGGCGNAECAPELPSQHRESGIQEDAYSHHAFTW